MNDLTALYQEMILDHNKSPRNFRKISDTAYHADGVNPLCGDELTVYLTVTDDIIHDASFEGKGCAISIASASLMTEALIGQTLDDAEALFKQFHDALTKDDASANLSNMGKLVALDGVKAYPARVKCATLAWHTSHAAMQCSQKQVTTEIDDV